MKKTVRAGVDTSSYGTGMVAVSSIHVAVCNCAVRSAATSVAWRAASPIGAILEKWQAFLDLEAILEHLAADADRRLAFQASYPVRAPSHPGPAH
jgi:hypothetical protein